MWYMKPGVTGTHKMDGRWKPGVWLGFRDRSNEFVVGTQEGCIKVRSIRQMPPDQRWGGELWEKMRGTPWEPTPGHPERELKSKVIVPPLERADPPVAREQEKHARRLYIRVKDVHDYGATEGCPGCAAAVKGEASRNHTEECRDRLTELIRKMTKRG